MHKTIQYFSLLSALFLFSSVPSYTNTETRPSRRQLQVTNRQNEKEKKKKPSQKRKTAKISKKETKLVPIAFTVVIVGGISALIFFLFKKHTSSAENDQPDILPIDDPQNEEEQPKPISKLNANEWEVTLDESPGEQGNEATLTVTLKSKKVNKDDFLEEINYECESLTGLSRKWDLELKRTGSQIVIKNFRKLSLYEQEKDKKPNLKIRVSYRDQKKNVEIPLGELKESLKILSQTKYFFKVKNNLPQTIQNENEYLDTCKHSNGDETKDRLYAVEKGYPKVLSYYLQKDPQKKREKLNFKYTDENDNTLIHIAVINENEPMITELMKEKADLSIKNGAQETPFDMMVSQYKTVDDIISLMPGKNVNYKDGKDNTLLYYAFLAGKYELALRLINQKASTFLLNGDDQSAFSLVMSEKISFNTAKELIGAIIKSNNNQVDAQDKKKRTLLHHAVIKNKIQLVEYLIQKKGAKLDIPDIHNGTPLIYAASGAYLQIVQLIIKKANNNNTLLNLLNDTGLTYSMTAAEVAQRKLNKLKKRGHTLSEEENKKIKRYEKIITLTTPT